MRHTIVVSVVSILQGRLGPLATVAVFQAVAYAVLYVVRGRRDDDLDGFIRNLPHDVKAISLPNVANEIL